MTDIDISISSSDILVRSAESSSRIRGSLREDDDLLARVGKLRSEPDKSRDLSERLEGSRDAELTLRLSGGGPIG